MSVYITSEDKPHQHWLSASKVPGNQVTLEFHNRSGSRQGEDDFVSYQMTLDRQELAALGSLLKTISMLD